MIDAAENISLVAGVALIAFGAFCCAAWLGWIVVGAELLGFAVLCAMARGKKQ